MSAWDDWADGDEEGFAPAGAMLGAPAQAEDAHLEASYEERFEFEDSPEEYEPSPYDGTYSEE